MEAALTTWWGPKQDRSVTLTRAEILRGAHHLLLLGFESAPGKSEMERAAWRATVKRGLLFLAEEEGRDKA